MYKIMAVDDEIWVLRGLQKQVEVSDTGFELDQSFTQPLRALDALERHPADVVLVDIQMPGLSGLEFIRRAKVICPRALYVLVTAFSEFDYAREAIQLGVREYLVKPIAQSDLTKLLSSIRGQLDHLALMRGDDYLYGFLKMYAKQLPREAVMGELGFSGQGCFCLWGCYCRMDPERKLASLARGICDTFHAQRTAFTSEDGQFQMVLAYAPPEILRGMSGFVEEGVRELGIKAGTSGIFDETDRLGDAVTQTQWAALQSFVDGGKTPMALAKAQGRMEMPGEIRALLEKTSLGRIQPVIREWARGLVLENQQVSSVFYQVFELLQILSKRASGEKPRELLSLLTSPVSMVELFGSLGGLVDEIARRIVSDEEPGLVDPDQIRAYLDKNYLKPILVSEVAEYFSMDAAYLGRMFRQKQGVGIKDYLNKRRMEHAAKLLDSTSIGVREIAASCGITDYFYFIKLFKKHYGIPPAQYRNAKKCNRSNKSFHC